MMELEYLDTKWIKDLLNPKMPMKFQIFSGAVYPASEKLFDSGDLDKAIIESYYFQFDKNRPEYSNNIESRNVFIYSIPGGICAGDGFIFYNEELVRNADTTPYYFFDLWIKDAEIALPYEWGAFLSVKSPKIIVSDLPCAVIFHPSMVYGHFILEILPKILLLSCLKLYGAKFRVCASRHIPLWARACLETYFTTDEIILYDPATERVAAPTIIQPALMHDLYRWHPMMNVLVDKFINDARSQTGRPDAAGASSKVYLSRAKIPHLPKGTGGWHHLDNEAEVEKVFSDNGFDIIHPQEWSIAEQLAIYSAARVLAGPYGSGLHNALFLPRNSRVIGLNRINPVQEWIAQLRSQGITFVKPSGGWINGSNWQPGCYYDYTIDITHLRDVLSRYLAWDGVSAVADPQRDLQRTAI